MKEDKGDLIDMEEAIAVLKTSRPTFYRWLRSGRIPGMKAGRQWRFYRSDIEAFLKGQEPQIALAADVGPLIEALDRKLKEAGAPVPPRPSEEHKVRHVVNQCILLASACRASDIHVTAHLAAGQSTPEAVIRIRVDGVLHVAAAFDIRLLPAVVKEWKAMAACNVRETALPQDGRCQMALPGRGGQATRPLDLRINFLPATLGETVVARILDPAAAILTLERLPFGKREADAIRQTLALPNGLLITTGPLGSGKTTTLYACLNHLASPERKLMTVEDPVEYILPWVTQIPVRAAEGVTFERALRACLRADPDVLMLGELRSLEAAVIAVQAALTGHLVLTTMHTQDAAQALVRLRDVGVDPFLIGSAVRLIVAQRLIRMLCPHCRRKAKPTADEAAFIARAAKGGGIPAASAKQTFMSAPGCEQCARTGYRGRTAAAEALVMSPEISQAVRAGAGADEIRAIAVRHGMTTMAADGVRRAAAGETSLSEVIRVLSST